jgi:hypothetical protein
VLVDVLSADPKFGPTSREAVRSCLREGGLTACEVVWAETAAGFPAVADASVALDRLGVRFTALDVAASEHAATAWRDYRQRGGRRDRVIADFLVGAHASATADRLLTRDRGFYRAYFADLPILDPSP